MFEISETINYPWFIINADMVLYIIVENLKLIKPNTQYIYDTFHLLTFIVNQIFFKIEKWLL